MTNSNKVILHCEIGKDTIINDFVNLYGCIIGELCMVGTFVEIQKNAVVGNRVKIQSHTFICEGITIENDVFIGHHVVFTNDKYPKATANGGLQKEGDWNLQKTIVRKGASIGSNATILPGVVIGEGALVGAGSVVTRDVPAHSIVSGNPARLHSKKGV
jgi:acetyltransferase-like isoleucine patch superfamily enzyme